MKKFTIVFPSRERPILLRKILDSITKNTFSHDDIEVLIAIDNDDHSYDNFEFPFFVQIFRVKRSLNFSRDYYSFLAAHGTGKWIIGCNDDGEFMTPDWDLKSSEVLDEYIGNGPNVVHGWIEDGLGNWRAKGHGKYCCFPLIGRDGFDAMGFLFPDRIPTWGADLWTRKIYDAIDRVIELPMTIKHHCYHNQTREADHINQRIMDNQIGYDFNPKYEEINILLEKLRYHNLKK